jgi:UDP-glucose 4-epimerase
LLEHPKELRVLGDGKQRKSYLYVQDCIDAMLTATRQAQEKVNVFNLGTDEYCKVDDSIDWICEQLGVCPKRVYSGGDRGWIGDNPFIFLDCSKIRSLGWKPQLSIHEGILRTVTYLQKNHWVLERR